MPTILVYVCFFSQFLKLAYSKRGKNYFNAKVMVLSSSVFLSLSLSCKKKCTLECAHNFYKTLHNFDKAYPLEFKANRARSSLMEEAEVALNANLNTMKTRRYDGLLVGSLPSLESERRA